MSLLYRIYLPDNGRDLTGGVGLPDPELHLADGQVLRASTVFGGRRGQCDLEAHSTAAGHVQGSARPAGQAGDIPCGPDTCVAGLLTAPSSTLSRVPISASVMAHPSGWADSTPTSTTATSRPKSTAGSATFWYFVANCRGLRRRRRARSI